MQMRPSVEAASDWMKCHTGTESQNPRELSVLADVYYAISLHSSVCFQSGFPDTPWGKIELGKYSDTKETHFKALGLK